MKPILYTLIALLFIRPAHAEGISLGWPVACTKDQDCWIVHLVDRDPATNTIKDYMCGHLTYDGHDGTDIAVRDRKTMEEGHVAVLAAAAGTVLRIRNTVPDGHGETGELTAVKKAGEECGNGVVISHGDGWETQYCHMKQGSVIVHPGEHVHKGSSLGTVGESGMAEFPHLHFGVRHNGATVDPFISGAMTTCGADGGPSLWDKQVPYDPVMIYAAGLSARIPDYKALLQDASSPPTMSQAAPVLAFWILLYGAQAGDRVDMRILDSSDAVYAEEEYVQPKPQIRSMHFIGKDTSKNPLRPGTYIGKATLTRIEAGGQKIVRSTKSVIAVAGVAQ